MMTELRLPPDSHQDRAAAEPIAIIGMACRVPGAADEQQFWRNLVDGVDSIRRFSREEQAALGVPEQELDDPDFVPAAPVIDDAEYFDAALFGMSARDAELTDPHHRLLLELAHTALEDAGHDPARHPGRIGVYAGTGHEDYKFNNIYRNAAVMSRAGQLTVIGSDPDYVATLASYRLNLRGPSLTLHTACSTSLVALHLACVALRSGDCDLALAGGVHVPLPLGRGYLHVEGGILSPDGVCRPFDASAAGTIWGAGGGVTVLRRLSDALADGDHIRALVRGSAVNNDGSKATFSGPSVAGQAETVTRALEVARVDPRTVSYVEAHATGTAVGDPIEVAALTQVFGARSEDRGWCALGSVKSNIGHLSQAAGIASVIKTVLALEHAQLPPTLHVERPNPAIDLESSPFYLNTTLSDWDGAGAPRRAGVSSFGVGGTNAHAVLEQAPMRPARPGSPGPARPRLLRISAASETALSAAVGRLGGHLAEHPGLDLADVAHTLAVGRGERPHRTVVVARDAADAAAAVADRGRLHTGTVGRSAPQPAFLFSGQGAQYAGMGAQLYAAEPAFRDAVDACAEVLSGELPADIRDVMFATGDARQDADRRLTETGLTQPALFTVEYALAQLWLSWGLQPAAMIGHSIGEYVAATVAGVFRPPDALRLVALRGRLMQAMPPGSMLAVQLDAESVAEQLPAELAIATVNAPGSCVVSGPTGAVQQFAARLADSDVASTPLRTSHAFHSPMMEPILDRFAAAVGGVPRQPPQRGFLSNLTGDWIAADQATDPGYWARHLRHPVRFGDCVARLLSNGDWALVELGPGRQLAGLARAQTPPTGLPPLPSLPSRNDRQGDLEVLADTVGRLWTVGVPVPAGAVQPAGRRVRLPGYPYERKYFWIEPDPTEPATAQGRRGPVPVDDWFTVPTWRQVVPAVGCTPFQRCLAFVGGESAGRDGLSGQVVAGLRAAGVEVVEVVPGDGYGQDAGGRYTVRPGQRTDFDKLVADLVVGGGFPPRVVHAWPVAGTPAGSDVQAAWQAQDLGFFSLLWLAQAVAGAQLADPVHLDVLTAGTQDVTGLDLVRPEHATVAGVAKVVPLEVPSLTVRHVDLDLGPAGDRRPADAVVAELLREPRDPAVALRHGRRWVPDYQPVPVPPRTEPARVDGAGGLRERGVYLVTGGLGGLGRTLAEDLAGRARARLILVGRSGLPPREDWDAELAARPAGRDDGGRARRAIASVRRMEAAGAEVLVAAADVASVADLRRVREQVLRRFGRVDGILHAAGLPGGGMAEVKERAAAEQVLAPKLAGTLALCQAFGDLDLDFVALFSSVTAVAGGYGQVDYCAANAFLDAFARSPGRFRGRTLSIDWGPWLEVGMAAEAGTGEPTAGAGEPTAGTGGEPIGHPILGTRLVGQDGLVTCAGTVSPDTQWLLDEHRVAGVPVLPGTAHLELAGTAVRTAAPPDGRAMELRDVTFDQPLAVTTGGVAEVRVQVAPGPGDTAQFQVRSGAGETGRVHARGSAGWVDPGPPPRHDLAVIQDRCPPAEPADPAESGTGNLVTVGPHWPDPTRVYVGAKEQLALVEAGDRVAGELDRYWLHPALLDRATAFPRLPDTDGAPYLPLGYGRLLVRGRLPARVWSHVRYTGSVSDEVIAADVSLLDDEGRELVAVDEFLLRRVDPATAGGAVRDADTASTVDGDRVGIRPRDGVEAFHRLLGTDLGRQVVVGPVPVPQLLAEIGQGSTEAVDQGLDEAGTAAPAGQPRLVGGDYVAPRTELEATLAKIWADVLGVGEVGVDDDLFELGGNSLLGVQLIAQVRKAVNVRLPMRTLFEAPTVAGMAIRVEELRSAGSTDESIPRLPRG